jgi:N-acetylmuramoyl-L-alanine amidase
VRLNRLLPGLALVGALLVALPAEAARLAFWRFDTDQNRLTFATDERVQPSAQLLSNPTRLVISLPSTALSAPETQSYDGAIKEVRVDAVDAETTRLVVEYNAGYTVDPEQVRVQGENSRQWSVQLPEAVAAEPSVAESAPELATESTPDATEAVSSPSAEPVDRPIRARLGDDRRTRLLETDSSQTDSSQTDLSQTDSSEPRNRVNNRPVEEARSRIQGISATTDGFLIRTTGESPEIDVSRSEENGQRSITLRLEETAIALGLMQSQLPVDRYSVDSWRLDQVSDSPATAQVTLILGADSPDWEVSSTSDGVVILPKDVDISRVPDAGTLVAGSATAAMTTQRSATTRQLSDEGDLPTMPNGQFTVVIDPGHGGRDPGAVGIDGLQEKQVVNDIAPQVAAILREQGVTVVMTRDRDIEVDLEPRVATAERANASVFVSIHANAISMSRPDVNGLETFYASDAGHRLANTVHATVLRAMGMRDRRVRSARFYVIRQTSMPAILIETGFVTGAEDAPNLADPAWRERMAAAIAQGILIHLAQGL